MNVSLAPLALLLAAALTAGCFDSQGEYETLDGRGADCDPDHYETHCAGNVKRSCPTPVREDCSDRYDCPSTTPTVSSESCSHLCAIVANTSATSPDHARCLE